MQDVTSANPDVPSSPGGLDAGPARHERFGEIRHQFADVTQNAAEAEMHHEHES
jgi:hypothetical protein